VLGFLMPRGRVKTKSEDEEPTLCIRCEGHPEIFQRVKPAPHGMVRAITQGHVEWSAKVT
jgi:hypothetical protein